MRIGLMRTWLAFAGATVVFYAAPLFSSQASIHWDLADVSYPAQKYFEESIRGGKLPHWTPYLDSGIPFLSDPRTGAWYPLHWPFFAIGITPRAMVWELALHAFLAMGGAFLLARRWLGEPGPAAVGAILYAWGGFFAAHSSNLPLFETAALLPWLLWAALRALESGTLRWMALAGMIGGLIALAGDPRAAFSCLAALICFAIAARAPWKRTVTVIAYTAVCAFLLSAIQTLPSLELNAYTSHPNPKGGVLHFRTLATFIAADYYGVIAGLYSGPDDIRQNYLYSGLLMVPLALAGIVNAFSRREKLRHKCLTSSTGLQPVSGHNHGRATGKAFVPTLPILALIVPAVLYACTVSMDSWFIAALGLSMAAAYGVVWAIQRVERPHLWIALLVLSAVDLWYWNMNKDPLVYARIAFSDLYGKALPLANEPFSRIWSPYTPLSMGPADGPLLSRTEVTYGSGLAELDRYADYLHAAEGNSKLLNGLGVTHVLEARGKLQENPSTLGRVSVPPRVQFVPDRAAAQAALATLDPAQSAVVEGPPRVLSPGISTLAIVNYLDDLYRVRIVASGASLLRFAVPYFPGWTAAVDGRSADLVPVDEALTGVFVPPGEHHVTLQYRSTWFRLGALLSGLGVITLLLSYSLT